MRWIISWALFWCGDAVSRLQRLIPDWPTGSRLGVIQRALYRIYAWFMSASDAVQGGGAGPWKDVASFHELSADPKIHEPRR
jgi:hypothetical protein